MGWEPPEYPQTPTITFRIEATQTLTPRFEATPQDASCPNDVVFAGYGADTERSISQEGPIRGDWFELRVMRHGGIDLRGWRVTDNDTKTSTDEGSLVFTDNPALVHVPQGTRILVLLNPALPLSPDDLDARDRRLVLHIGNGNLDTYTPTPGLASAPTTTLCSWLLAQQRHSLMIRASPF